VRSQDGAGHGAGDTAQPTGVTPQEPTMPEPHNPTPPHQP
jgi:hypothetical protein